jgi:hypothetical protein
MMFLGRWHFKGDLRVHYTDSWYLDRYEFGILVTDAYGDLLREAADLHYGKQGELISGKKKGKLSSLDLGKLFPGFSEAYELFDNAVDSLHIAQQATQRNSQLEIRVVAGKNMWGVAVEDNGIGINPDLETGLFSPVQSTKEDDELFGGKGLGLSTVHHAIQRLGGSVSYVNKGPGMGAIFWYEVPL